MAEAPSAWPIAVRTGWIDPDAEQKALNLTRMDAVEKRLVWQCFTRMRPELVRLLRDDEGFAALRTAFPHAEVIVPFAEIQRERNCADYDAATG
jgi:hypothetical protein